MASMINLFFLCQSGMRIELGRSFRFLLALSLCGTGLLYCDYHRLFYTRHSPWTSHRLILSLICLESWSHPTELTTLPPLPLPPFPCWLLPAMICKQLTERETLTCCRCSESFSVRCSMAKYDCPSCLQSGVRSNFDDLRRVVLHGLLSHSYQGPNSFK
mmetsp:Transcript_43903/g.138587  ORF Transcript_43903/g.138587 Transcript_43903/m.138587 type:complete len:159 (+) Transcript_43903:287-763(+)